MNLQKSEVFFSDSTPPNIRRLLSRVLKVRRVSNPGFYLGLPTLIGRSKSEALRYIVEKVSKRVEGWKEKYLTLAGKEILIKSVASALPIYTMSCFLLPKVLCKDIMKIQHNFWWGQDANGKKIH
uniref:Uncharacterized protein n=1 Tax=Nelumbo nucifera TaxID=4432 RepID=A0A822ZF80_NELNU|nr:TPA_asm: hypothetical protein HUJ06_001767 [Nelumbo nucifera]